MRHTRAADGQLLLFAPYPLTERTSSRARYPRVDVRPDGEVVLTIPHRGSRAAALRFLEQSRGWIERTRARLVAASPPPPAPRWDGSDTVPLRGVTVPLRVVMVPGRRACAQIDGDAVTLHVPARWASQGPRLQRLLLSALREEARRDAQRVLGEEAARLGLRHAGLSIRDARSRWGSCGANGTIMLSLRLILAPPEVLRYVAIHELCHLRWRGHGPRFWALVARQMPEYAMQRAWLRRHGDALQGLL